MSYIGYIIPAGRAGAATTHRYDAAMPSITRVRAMPWVMVFELAVTLRKHWRRLEPKERARLTELIKKSQGRPGNLSRPQARRQARTGLDRPQRHADRPARGEVAQAHLSLRGARPGLPGAAP